MTCEEAQELITGLADNELSDAERASIEGHLQACESCRLAYRQEQLLKADLRGAAAIVTVPDDLREKILVRLGRTRETKGPATGRRRLSWPLPWAFRPAFAFALVLLLALPVLYLMRAEQPSIALSTLESHERIVAGRLSYIREKNPRELQAQLTRAVEGQFAPMGYDLSMMGLQPAGGAVQEVAGRKILIALYEGNAPTLTCYTFFGTERDAPKGAALIADPEKNVNFYTFSRQGINGVMHREGRLICVLVSTLPMEELLALARSKARSS